MSDELKPEIPYISQPDIGAEFMTTSVMNRPPGINFDNTSLIAAYLENGFKNLIVKNNIVTPATKVDWQASSLVTKSATGIAFHSGIALITIDFSLNGAKNRLDTGSLAQNTQYAIWAIYDKDLDEIAGLGSLSFTNPTMPTGFTFKKLIGFITTKQIATTIIPFYQIDNDFTYLESLSELSYSSVSTTSFTTVANPVYSGNNIITKSVLIFAKVGSTIAPANNIFLWRPTDFSSFITGGLQIVYADGTALFTTGLGSSLAYIIINAAGEVDFRVAFSDSATFAEIRGIKLNI